MPRATRKTTLRTHLDLPKECDNIVSKAMAGENTIVTLGCLIFVTFANGDAFALDVEDKFGCPLCLEGNKQRYPLFETETQWTFEWPCRYYVSRGWIHFERTDGGDSSELPWLKAGPIKREVAWCNRNNGMNYQL